MRAIAILLITSLFAGDYFKRPTEEPMNVSETHYDYSTFAEQLTSDCEGDYQKIRAIYEWICQTIEYDNTLSIHTADSCVDTRRGVCQAYCELFYRLAEAVDVNVEIISGKSKNKDGDIVDTGHAWLFAYTRENHGILLDPTWGSGTSDGICFTRSDDPWDWFDVSPEWMILSHFPDDPSYQLLDDPLSLEEFASLPTSKSLWKVYGLDTGELFKKARRHTLYLPEFYSGGEGMFEIVDFPMTPSLKIGETYTFRVKIKQTGNFAVVNNNIVCKLDEWLDEGNGICSVDFMLRDTGMVCFGIVNEQKQTCSNLVKYSIDSPTPLDWAKVEQRYPLSVPDARNVRYLYAGKWREVGIDEHQLLRLIRENRVSELPPLFNEKGQQFKIVSVPMNKQLKIGRPYTFRFYPQSGVKWILVNNDTRYREWEIDDDGLYTMTVTPTETGTFGLFVQLQENASYWQCLAYEVVE